MRPVQLENEDLRELVPTVATGTLVQGETRPTPVSTAASTESALSGGPALAQLVAQLGMLAESNAALVQQVTAQQQQHATLQQEHAALQQQHAALQQQHAVLQQRFAALQEPATCRGSNERDSNAPESSKAASAREPGAVGRSESSETGEARLERMMVCLETLQKYQVSSLERLEDVSNSLSELHKQGHETNLGVHETKLAVRLAQDKVIKDLGEDGLWRFGGDLHYYLRRT